MCSPRRPHKGQPRSDAVGKTNKMANDVEISFVDESDLIKQENRYFWTLSGRLGEQTFVRATSINNFSGIESSQVKSILFKLTQNID